VRIVQSALVMSGMNEDDKERQKRQQRMRSLAIALALGALVALFYVATIVRLGGNVMNRAI
jgi:threonine/homoserine efflux transporter RhtA